MQESKIRFPSAGTTVDSSNTVEQHPSSHTIGNTMLPAVRVQWSISATMECPHCEHDNDFMQVDEYWRYSQPGENKEKFFAPIEITCENCQKKFTGNGSDY